MSQENKQAVAGGFSWRLLLELALGIAVIVLTILLLTRPAPLSAEEPATEAEAPAAAVPDPTPEPVTVTVRFHSPTGTTEEQLEPGSRVSLAPAPIEGYTFLRWRNSQGQDLTGESLRVWEDTELYAVYAMAMKGAGHSPYMRLDENGAFRPSGTMTRREVACILYDQLDTQLVGDGVFLDVPEEDPAYRATATLKQLGILCGSRFHPDEVITRQEFFAMLCGFFPAGTEEAVFSDLDASSPVYPLFRTAAERGWVDSGADVAARPDEPLTRIEFVRAMSLVLNRLGDSAQRRELVGTILDVSSQNPLFWAVAEAAIVHRHRSTGEQERWTVSKPLPLREEGLFFLGMELHAIDANGDPVCSGEYAGLQFDAYGAETSGLPELDAQIRGILEQRLDTEKMTREEMLQNLFTYVVYNFGYRRVNYYPIGEPAGWEAQEALGMLHRRTGNCYSFAALFCELARAIGYDARPVSGAMLGDPPDPTEPKAIDIYGNPLEIPRGHVPHSWVEIAFDGEWYIFDPELAFLHARKGDGLSCFKMNEIDRARFGYLSSLDAAPADASAPADAPPSPSPAP